MRIDGIAPRTWLLATVAGWALVVWVLTVSGMGAVVQHLPDDPSLLMRLPQLAPPSPERLGPLAQYAEIGTRPLFSEDRRPQAFSLNPEGDEAAAPAFDFMLTSVLLTPTLKMAIVQPSAGGESIRIKLGEAAESQPAWRLTALNPRSAVFEGPEGQKTLDLRIYDGTGGEPPTATTVATDNGGANVVGPGKQPASKPTIKPAVPQPAPAQPPAPPPEDATSDAGDDPATVQSQVDSIRKRIEERRAQLRQQSQNPAAPAKNP